MEEGGKNATLLSKDVLYFCTIDKKVLRELHAGKFSCIILFLR